MVVKKSKANLEVAYMSASSILLFVGLLFSSCAEEQKQGDAAQTASLENDARFISEKRDQDAQFLVKAASIHLEQMKLGLLAQQLGKLDDVKALGLKVEVDHTTLIDSLKVLSSNKKVSIPAEITHDSQELYNKLNTVPLTDFDKLFSDTMVKSHEFAIDLFERAANGAYDPEIREWAQGQLSVLRVLLEQSKTCLLKSGMFIPDAGK